MRSHCECFISYTAFATAILLDQVALGKDGGCEKFSVVEKAARCFL